MSASGALNLSPYSFFNAVSDKPHMVAVLPLVDRSKDALAFYRGDGRVRLQHGDLSMLRDAMNATSCTPCPRGESEFAFSGLTPAPSRPGQAAPAWPRALRPSNASSSGSCRWNLSKAHRATRWWSARWWASISTTPSSMTAWSIPPGVQPIARAGYKDYFVANHSTKFSITRPPRRRRSQTRDMSRRARLRWGMSIISPSMASDARLRVVLEGGDDRFGARASPAPWVRRSR